LSFIDPDLIRFVLQAIVAALVNVQAVDGADAELKRLAISRTYRPCVELFQFVEPPVRGA